MAKMENTMRVTLERSDTKRKKRTGQISAVDRARVEDFLNRLERYFVTGT
jgi:hypothetical protein